MNTFEILSLILNSLLVLIGAGTIWVVILIYKFQKQDFEKSKKADIQPKPEVIIIEYYEIREKRGNINMKFLYNPARKVIVRENKNEFLKFDVSNKILNQVNDAVFVIHFQIIKEDIIFESLQYEFKLFYEDVRGNEYISKFICKGRKVVDRNTTLVEK